MRTFPRVLQENAVHADRAVTFMRADGEERKVSFPDLWQTACQRAQALYAVGLQKGDRVALVLPEPDEFVLTFMACLTAGIVAVPMYPPQTLAKLEAYGDTVRHILAASGAKVLITSATLKEMLASHIADSARIVLESEVRGDAANAAPPPAVDLEDLAFLQFTSGSTSKPKGVMVTFGNLAANAHAIMVDGLKSTPADKGVSWLPLYHDMGLIGFVVAPLYTLVQVMFLPTMAFIRRPSIWLDAIHRFRGTITFAPNFAYALAARAITDAQSKSWDLSCMRHLGCGAEPIQADVLRAFLSRFAPNGLAPTSVLPSYGMAEATLAITFWDDDKELKTDVLDIEAMRAGVARPPQADGPASKTMELVACGRAFPNHELKISNARGDALPERHVGEIWVKGPSVTRGYYGDPEATEETFGGGWLRTGDLGYVADGNVFICGRAKDLIIINGKNYYPQDIEAVVSRAPGVRDGQCVAFSDLDDTGAERCVLVAEAKIGPRAGTIGDIVAQIVQLVRAEIGIVPSEVHLIKRGTLPKTSSGKVRRREAKRRLAMGELEFLTEADSKADSLPPSVLGAEAGMGPRYQRPEASDGIQ
ncbi:MAG: fatty acyl-AMP ligase [Polyangiaceae bacterium]|nr:fatty acyl-AMP ligase [Polyangiaceae bacterium]